MLRAFSLLICLLFITSCDADYDPEREDVLDICRHNRILSECVSDLNLSDPDQDPDTFACPESQGAVLEHCRKTAIAGSVKPRWQILEGCQGSVQ